VRQHAAQWHVDPHKVGVIGFSAGGHLVAAVSTHFAQRTYAPVDAADKLSCRPTSPSPSTPATCGRTRTRTRPPACPSGTLFALKGSCRGKHHWIPGRDESWIPPGSKPVVLRW
jgi:hypothetical protein